MELKNFIIVLGVLSMLVLVGCAQQQTEYICPDGTTVSDSSLCPKQCKNVQVPYEAEECDMYFDYDIQSGSYQDYWKYKGDSKEGFSFVLINNEDEGGNFRIEHEFYDAETGQRYPVIVQQYVEGNSQKRIEVLCNNCDWQSGNLVHPGSGPNKITPPPAPCKTVTKYRTEEQCS